MAVSGLHLGDLRARGGDEFLVGVGVASDAPTTVVSLREKHPGALGHGRIVRCLGDHVGEAADRSELLVTVKRASVGTCTRT